MQVLQYNLVVKTYLNRLCIETVIIWYWQILKNYMIIARKQLFLCNDFETPDQLPTCQTHRLKAIATLGLC